MCVPLAIACASAVLCVYVAGHTWRAARMERWADQRWFAATALTAALYIALDCESLLDLSPTVRLAMTSAQLLLACLHIGCWMVFTERLLDVPRTRLDLAILAALVGVVAVTLAPGLVYRGTPAVVGHVEWLHATYYRVGVGPLAGPVFALILLSFCRPIGRMVAASRRHDEARWYATGLVLLLACGVNDALVSAYVYPGPLMLGVGFLVPIAMAAMVQTDRLVRTARDLDLLSVHLEREVDERSRALVQARASLDRSERLAAIGQLAAGVAHEVNNPAAALQANLAYLCRCLDQGPLPGDARECLDDSLLSVERIARIVRELRDSARAAANPAEIEPVSLSKAVQGALCAAKPHLAGAEVRVDVDPALYAAANEDYLVQVLTNLAVNAAQATPAGARAEIAVHAARSGELVRLEVRDRGSGMSAEVQARLFEPFFTTKPVGRGTGLGLAVSRGLVQAMHGAIEVVSAVGQGTAICVVLPAAIASARPAARPVALRGPSRRALLIDDDPEVRNALARDLGQCFEVKTATGVQDGLVQLLSGPPPELVICDLVMADGGGARLYRLLAAGHPELARRVVFVTGGAIHPDDVQFLSVQPQPVLMKPLHVGQLLEAAARLAA